MINVLERGVVADWNEKTGTGTNNRVAIQTIIDEVTNPLHASYKKSFHFPSGQYWADWDGAIGRIFNVPDDLVIVGDGPDTTRLHVGPKLTPYSYDVFLISAKRCNFSIAGIHLEGGPDTASEVQRRAVSYAYGKGNIGIPTVTPAVPGSQYYEYRVIGKGANGTFVSSEPGVTSAGNAVLSANTRNAITWAAHPDADAGYDVVRYRGVGAAIGKIGSVPRGVTTFDDSGQAPTAFPQNTIPKTVHMENCRVTHLSHAIRLASDGVDVWVADCDIRHELVALRHFDNNGGPFWRADGQEFRSKLTVNRCQILYARNPNVTGEHTGYHFPSIDVTYDSCMLDSRLVGIQINNQGSAVPERGGSLAVTNTIFGSQCATGINGHQGTPTMVTNCVFLSSQHGIRVAGGGAVIQGCQFRLDSRTAQAGISVVGGILFGPCLVSNCFFNHSATIGQIYNDQEVTQPLVFSNCVFTNPRIEAGTNYSLLQQHMSGTYGDWEFVNCTWELVGSMRLPLFEDARKVSFRGCTLRSEKFLGVSVGTTRQDRKTELVLEDCELYAGGSPTVLIRSSEGPVTVRGRNNQFLGSGPEAPAAEPGRSRVLGYLTPRQSVGSAITIAGGQTKIALNENASVFHVTAAAPVTITRMVLTVNNDNSTRYFYGPFTLVFDDNRVTLADTSSETSTDKNKLTGRLKPLRTVARNPGTIAQFFYDVSRDIWYEL